MSGQANMSMTIQMAFDLIGIKDAPPVHIKQNESLTKDNGAQFEIIRRSEHDGSGNFSADVLFESIQGMLRKETYAKGMNYDPKIHDIEYEIGLINWNTLFKDVELSFGIRPGQVDTIKIPVSCIITPNPPKEV